MCLCACGLVSYYSRISFIGSAADTSLRASLWSPSEVWSLDVCRSELNFRFGLEFISKNLASLGLYIFIYLFKCVSFGGTQLLSGLQNFKGLSDSSDLVEGSCLNSNVGQKQGKDQGLTCGGDG